MESDEQHVITGLNHFSLSGKKKVNMYTQNQGEEGKP